MACLHSTATIHTDTKMNAWVDFCFPLLASSQMWPERKQYIQMQIKFTGANKIQNRCPFKCVLVCACACVCAHAFACAFGFWLICPKLNCDRSYVFHGMSCPQESREKVAANSFFCRSPETKKI